MEGDDDTERGELRPPSGERQPLSFDMIPRVSNKRNKDVGGGVVCWTREGVVTPTKCGYAKIGEDDVSLLINYEN